MIVMKAFHVLLIVVFQRALLHCSYLRLVLITF